MTGVQTCALPILNKNTEPGGNPEKYLLWTRTLEERYHSHPYINFFLSLTNNLINNEKEAEIQHKKMLTNLRDDYWKQKFNQFGLTEIVNNFPTNFSKSQEALEMLRKDYKKF